MPDLKQALKDLVATSNSGKYTDEATLLSKFPELKEYDVNSLRDFVATSNSGKYTSDDELFSKFPEFNIVGVKKKESSSPVSQVGMEDLQDGFDFSQPTFEAPSVLTPKAQEEYIAEQKTKPAPVVAKSPETSAVPKGWETYQAPTKEDEQGLGLNILSSLNRSIYKNLIGTPIKALGTFIEGTTSLLPRQIRSETGKGIISESLIDFGNYFNNAIDEISPQDKEFKDSLTDQFAQAFGQVASTILTAGVGTYASKGLPLVSKGASMLAKPLSARGAALAAAKEAGEQIVGPAGISSALTMGQSEYERAKQAGASDEQAYEAFYKNAVTGSVLETIPVMQFLKRFNTATNGGVLNYIKTKGVAGLTGGVEELTTEVLQTIYGNKTAQEIYNENQNLFEGVGTAGGIGFGVGFLLNAMGANAKILRKDGKNNEADVLENQIEALQSQAESGPPPVYKINGLKIESASIVNDMIERMDAPDLFKLNIEIDNDPVLKNKLQDKIVTSSIMEQVREANPELNEPSLKAITELEKQLTLLEGNKTQTGKDKAAAIRGQIKNIQENQLQEEAVSEAVVAEAPEIAQQRVDRIAEIETTIANDDATFADTGNRPLLAEARTELQTELETLKSEQDAVQKQTAGQVPVLTEAGVGEEVVQGEPQAKPKVFAKEGVQEEVTTAPAQEQEVSLKTSMVEMTDEEIVEYNPIEEIADKNNEILSKTLKSKKIIPQAEPQVTDLGDTVVFEYNNFDEDETRTRLTFKKNEDGSITPKGVKLENNTGDIRGTDLFRNYVDTKRAEAAQEQVTAQVQVAEQVVAEEQFVPLANSDIEFDVRFSKENASDLVEDEREGENGRSYTYISEVETPVSDVDGEQIGYLVKMVDEDKNLSFEARDADGNNLSKNEEGFGTLGEAKQALLNNHNKQKKKEFDREVKAKAKEKVKADAKAAKAKEKAEAKKPVKAEPVVTETIDDLLDLDVADQDNLDKIFNALDNADKNIGKRLRTGANDALLAIPLGTVQVVIKAIKALVKGGMLLRDAIKKVAADNNLTESQVSDVLNIAVKESSYSDLSVEGTGIKLTGNEEIKKGENTPTVTKTDGYQDDYSEEDILNAEHAPNSRVVTYASNIASGEISYTKDGEKITFKLPYVNKAAVKKIKSLKDKYKAVKGASKEAKIEKEKLKQEINKVSKQVIKDFTDVMTQNLLALYDTLTPEFVANSKDWYVGANRMANAIAQKYNMTVDQVGGIMAVLSPQNDWFNNVSVAERVINIMTKYGDTKLTKDVVDKAVKYNSKTGEPNNFATDLIELFNQYGEVSINELDKLGISQLTQSAILRAFDQGLNSPKVAMTDPQGFFIGFDKTPVRWNSEAEISKAIGIFRNGDIKNVNKNLGNGNKVRNFYNNIVDPNSKTPYLTADTHALSAALNGPISANDAGGFGLFNGSLEPAYALVKSAYIQAAKIAGIKPREMQSITWEAQRIGINDKNRTEEKKQETFDYIEKSRTNEKTSYERATELIEKNRSADPEWGKSRGIRTQKTSDEILKGAELRSKQRVGSISDLRGSTTGGLGESDTEMGGEVTGRQGIDEVLDLDVTDKDNLDKVFGFLDNADKGIGKILKGGANEAMLAIPLNVVRVAIKTLKALVQGGMLLRDAIKKVAADNNISQESVKDILNIAPIQEEFNYLMNEVDKLIARQKSRGIEDSKITSNIDTFIRKRDEYLNANDAQKKIIEREARGKMGAAPKRAVSIGRVLGALKDITNISRAEKLKIISQIRQLSKDAAKDLAKEIRSMASSGIITANQAANIVARFGKVNMLSEISVSKFVDYMAKVFANAEYAAKLSQANRIKKDISKLSKNKDKNANLRDLAQKFIKIDPSMVEDIDAYNDMASKIKEAIKGSTIRGAKVKFADTVNIENATEYIDKTIDAQNEMMRQQKAEEIQDLMGVDVSDLSYEDMMQLLDSKEPITKYNEGIIRSTINKMFNIYSTLIETALDTGKDPFTDEDIEFTKEQKDLVKSFMGMDLSMLSPKEALQAVDALSNFLQNKSTAKMESVVSDYTGVVGAKEISEEGIKAFPLKKYNMEWLGKLLGEQFTNLNILFERMFKGFRVGAKVMGKMGFTKLVNKKAFAEKQSNNIIDKYVDNFYKREANGEVFNSEYNNTERGLAAFMMRNVIGTAKEIQEEFNRRKGLIKESIDVLSKGNEKEKAKAEVYQKVYDKLIGETRGPNKNQILENESNNIDDIRRRTDKVNLEGIDFWMNEWADKYEQLSDVSENVYNKVLDKDLNYTPDRFSKLSSDTGIVELSNDESAFLNNTDGVIYKKETGVLMTATKPSRLPTNPKNGKPNRYIDLSFDNNNSNSMYDALTDINTAAPIRQIEGFLNSEYFEKIVPDSSNAQLLKERISLYIRNIRNKNPYSNDEIDKAIKTLNRIATIGVGQALGGPTQVVKQVVPVAMSTITNAGGLDVLATFNEDKNNFISNSGYSIANRGLESQAQVQSINRLIEEASKSKGEKLFNAIEKANQFWLKNFLVNADVYIARASWLTYYEQELKKLGFDTKGLDYKTHTLNEEAANYAQQMVDRQQNVSDSDLAGKMFASKDAKTQALVKGLMPFASFRMNQSARLGSDLAVLTNKTSTEEDKKIAAKSLSGYAVEAVTFRLIGIGIATILGGIVKSVMGDEEDEEDKKKRVSNIIKGARTGVVTDILSPLPLADKFVQKAASPLLKKIEEETNLPVSIYDASKKDVIESAGLFGIAAERLLQTVEIGKLAATGKYVDDFGREKTISDEKREALKIFIAPALLTNVGLLPTEVNTAVRYAIKEAKSKTTGDGALTRSALERWASSIDLSKMSKVAEFIKGKKEELSGKGDLAEKREFRKELEKDLLGKYEDKAQMRGADPELYKKNFGAESDWVKKGYAAEEILETKFNTILNKKKNLIKIEELKKQK